MITSKDRSVLIRLASALPTGSPEKKAVLIGLAKAASQSDEDYFNKTLKDDFARRAITKEEYLDWGKKLKDLEEDSQVSGLVDDYMSFRKNRSAAAKKAGMSPKAFWLLHIDALDKAMPKYNTEKVTDWNKVMKHYKAEGLRNAGSVAQSYHEYRLGAITKEQAAIQMATSIPNAQLILGVPL